MKVNLRLVEPNPFRDFKVDPVDPANVRELTRSIKEHGFWGGVVGRRKPGEPSIKQIIAGWTRIQAALKAGIEEADIVIGDFDDHETVRAYADENATQRGQNTTAVAGSIAAALREILLRELMSEQIGSDISRRPKSDGVGRDAILKELDGVTGITDRVVQRELANLKDNGSYDRIVREVTAKVAGEREAELAALAEAERQTKAAQKREEEAKAKREAAQAEQRKAQEERQKREAEAKAARDAEAKVRAEQARAAAEKREAEAKAKREKADAEAAKAKAEREAAKAREVKHAPAAQTRDTIIKMREAKHEVIFDSTAVTIHLKDPRYVETFKKLAVGTDGRKFLEVGQQGPLAKALAQLAVAKGREMSSAFITQEFSTELLKPKFLQRIVDQNERAKAKEAFERKGWEDQMTAHMDNFSGSSRSLLSAIGKIADLSTKRPPGATLLATGNFRAAGENLKAALRIYEGKVIGLS